MSARLVLLWEGCVAAETFNKVVKCTVVSFCLNPLIMEVNSSLWTIDMHQIWLMNVLILYISDLYNERAHCLFSSVLLCSTLVYNFKTDVMLGPSAG